MNLKSLRKLVWYSMALLWVLGAPACKDSTETRDADPAKGKATKPDKQTVAQVLSGKSKPVLLGHFADARFGMTEEELKAASPAFAKKGSYLSEQDFGVGYYVSLEGKPKRLTQLRVTVPVADAAVVEKAWGAPTRITYRRKPASLWLNPTDKIRAVLGAPESGKHSLIIEPYLPAKEILGDKGGPLGIESAKPFLGSSPDELKAAYPAHFDRALDTLAFMEWAPNEYGDAFKLQLGLEKGKVNALQFWLHHGDNDKVKQDMLTLLEAKYGKAKEFKTALGSKKLRLAKSPSVIVDETKGAWVIEVTKKK